MTKGNRAVTNASSYLCAFVTGALITTWSLSISTLKAATPPPPPAPTYTWSPVIYTAISPESAPLDITFLNRYALTNSYKLAAAVNATGGDITKAYSLIYRKTNTPTVTKGVTNYVIDTINARLLPGASAIQSASADTNVTVGFLPNNTTGTNLSLNLNQFTNYAKVVLLTAPLSQDDSFFNIGRTWGKETYHTLNEYTGLSHSQLPGVFVSPYVFAVGTNLVATNLSMPANAAFTLFYKGNIPLSNLTGKKSDSSTGLWLIGSDNSSGIKNNMSAIVNYGYYSELCQFKIITTNSATALTIFPGGSMGAMTYVAGDTGYPDSSTVISLINTPLPDNLSVNFGGGPVNSPYSKNYLITYSTYKNVIGKNCTPIAFNGAACTSETIKTGAYNLWAYNHIYTDPNATNAKANSMAQWLAYQYIGNTSDQLENKYSGAGYLSLKEMNVYRWYELYATYNGPYPLFFSWLDTWPQTP
jgi:hypothetical protein